MQNKYIVVIHGRHGNVVKSHTQELLKINKLVKEYYINPANDGETIIELVNKK